MSNTSYSSSGNISDAVKREFESKAKTIIEKRVKQLNLLLCKYSCFPNLKSQFMYLKEQLVNASHYKECMSEEEMEKTLQMLRRVVTNMSTKEVEKGYTKHEGIRYELKQFDREPIRSFGRIKKITAKELNSKRIK
ncbi:hypothetical protein EDI_195970 [Entamoeba dispar SAW760]|uniref:Uncharacterized protein n=1 Tax=Entamoeba dispar (strain ATCC PRA-260 / SAW760) TaxID=370354 RepID=B0EL11_ENTDS|nr:uncharacterized protein EDI_195970 [Entamoeba dispar SAW760]EDR24773.1 hypothetical protein EDI_195970 [Entamoeba dispar SAW760]|eukprot:EDR24773.1 hypothetical protein EDI_195970 [Entamoeba dispar SAW760]